MNRQPKQIGPCLIVPPMVGPVDPFCEDSGLFSVVTDTIVGR